MYKDCTHAGKIDIYILLALIPFDWLAVDYAFMMDEDASKKWSVAINVATNDPRFNYMSDMWFNPTYFGSA